jgi:hypothetical protein
MEEEKFLALIKQADLRMAPLRLEPIIGKMDMVNRTKVTVNQKH